MAKMRDPAVFTTSGSSTPASCTLVPEVPSSAAGGAAPGASMSVSAPGFTRRSGMKTGGEGVGGSAPGPRRTFALP